VVCSHLDHMFCPDGLELSLFVIRYTHSFILTNDRLKYVHSYIQYSTCTCTTVCTSGICMHVLYMYTYVYCSSCTFESTKVRKYFRKYFRTFVRKYESTKVPSKVGLRKYFRTSHVDFRRLFYRPTFVLVVLN
jgi:hypothetical protein